MYTPGRWLKNGAILAFTAWLAASASAKPPDEDHCPTLGNGRNPQQIEDAAPLAIREGMVLGYANTILLRELIPAEIWSRRNVFFFEGMRLEIGPCHRRYPVPSYFLEATQEFAGEARVDDDGNLSGYIAGIPFPPAAIEADDPKAGVKWAWNLEYRNRGSGPYGRFRITDMPSRVGGSQVYTGEFFQLRTLHRADRPASGFAHPGSEDSLWIGGGRFDSPQEARHLAWRQIRPVETERKYSQSDSTFVYVPTMRKVRRAASTWIDGMYTPRYRVGSDWGGGGVAVGSGGLSPSGSVNPTSALSSAITEHLPVGFNDLSLRPNAYVWRVLGEREVLAPINAVNSGYPHELNRNFGVSGLSVGSDRWEVRHAVIIEGAARRRGEASQFITVYVDYETQIPLYIITRKSGGLLVDVGISVHRFSGDIPDYPSGPEGKRAFVFDPVAAVYFHAADGGSGWRRESYDTRSIALPESALKQMTSVSALSRGH